MAYSQSKKLTAQEKKLLTLRTQLYGKEQQEVSPAKTETPTSFRFDSPRKSSTHILSNTHPETTYLKNDLKKITLLATVIFSIQVLLWFVVQRSIISLL